MRNEIIQGDALSVLKTLPDEYIQCCVTSPPYFGLRDYQTGEWAGGNPECDHLDKPIRTMAGFNARNIGREFNSDKQGETRHPFKSICGKCGATRIDQQIGLEETLDAYIARLVEVFREVRRVLRSDGTFWLNIGDSYAGSGKGPEGYNGVVHHTERQGFHTPKVVIPSGLKAKDLMLVPFRLAIALEDDGWWVRQTIIWNKPNCMPGSQTDRPTTSHEYIFLLSKRKRYYYDGDAIREPAKNWGSRKRTNFRNGTTDTHLKHHGLTNGDFAEQGRNKRSVWNVPTVSYTDIHFATFPPKLIEPCILAGSSFRACEICGAPWKRVIEETGHINQREAAHAPHSSPTKVDSTGWAPTRLPTNEWIPTCKHDNKGTHKGIVLDPFMGSGTVALVSIKHGRDYVGIELNPEYIELAYNRIGCVQPDLWTTEGEVAV